MKPNVQPDIIRLNQLQSEITGLYHEASQAMGISDSVSMILYELIQSGDGMTQSEICRLCCLPKQTVNSAVGHLGKEGFLRLEHGPGRAVRIDLTEEGHRYAEEKVGPLIRLENELLCDWTPEEREIYVRLTCRFRDGMREKLPTLKQGHQGEEK